MLANVISDLKSPTTMACYTTGDRAAIAATIFDKIKPIVQFLGDKKFLVGDDVTYVDFILFELCDFATFVTEGQLYQQYESLGKYFNRIAALPKLKEFFADDSKCIKRPYNNKISKLNN